MSLHKNKDSDKIVKKTINMIKEKYPNLKFGVKNAEIFNDLENTVIKYNFIIKFENKKVIDVKSESCVDTDGCIFRQKVSITPFGTCEYEDLTYNFSTKFVSKFSLNRKSIESYFNDQGDIRTFVDVMAEFDRMENFSEYPEKACKSIVEKFLDDKDYHPGCDPKWGIIEE